MRFAWAMPSRSLAGRLALAVTISVVAALSLTAFLTIWREIDRYGIERRAALTAIAEVFASGSDRATATDDADAAARVLRAIGQIPAITYAAIERSDGSVLAEQGLGLRLMRDAKTDDQNSLSIVSLLSTRTLGTQAAIRHNGEEVGHVVLVADTSDLLQQITRVAWHAALTSLLAIVIGLGVSLHLQRSVVRPLLALTQTMELVGNKHDYSQLASVTSDDEVGKLASTFNILLGAVNDRDKRLAQHGEHLENEVRVRTADLHDAKQAAESANAAKTTFLATMSHEIRTPMNGMLVMAELLASSELPARQRRYAQVIAQSGKSLLSIINDILDFAKVEAGKLELECVAMNPVEIADTVITLFAERARGAGLDLALSVAPSVPRLMIGDPVRFGQVISNLVSNALKFTQEGFVHLKLARDDATGELLVSVTDTGIGIAQDKLSSIFSAFTQADQSTTRLYGGTGLGLSITQRLVTAMNGTVGVESGLGLGSRFWARIPVGQEHREQNSGARVQAGPKCRPVVLRVSGTATRESLKESLADAGLETIEKPTAEPAVWLIDAPTLAEIGGRPPHAEHVLVLGTLGDSSAEQSIRKGHADSVLRWPVVQSDWAPVLDALVEGRALDQIERIEEKPIQEPTRFRSARVLVADDSAVNREVVIEALARCGVSNVTAVENGAVAVTEHQRAGFDLILMDGNMPVLDGYAATRAIREHSRAANLIHVPIIALTADVLSGSGGAWQQAEMDGYLAKPFTIDQLRAMLERHLSDDHRSQSEAPTFQVTPVSNSPTGHVDELIDPEVWGGLIGLGDADFIGRIAQLYRSQAPLALEALERAFTELDQVRIASAAHSLKSMSLNVGAQKLSEALKPIELSARSGTCLVSEISPAAIRAMLDETIIHLDRLQRELPAAA